MVLLVYTVSLYSAVSSVFVLECLTCWHASVSLRIVRECVFLFSRRYASAWGGVWHCQRCHHVEPCPQCLQRRRLRVWNHLCHPGLCQGTGLCCACVLGVTVNEIWWPESNVDHIPGLFMTNKAQSKQNDGMPVWANVSQICHHILSCCGSSPRDIATLCNLKNSLMWFVCCWFFFFLSVFCH